MTEKTINKFQELLKLNVNDKIEKKKSGSATLTYLSWSFAVAEMEKAYPDWEYNILEFSGLPYQFDQNTGYLVWTEIKAGGKTKKMWLPVMDGSNKAMKDKSYSYFVKGYNNAPPVEKFVEAASMFDINKTIMRCLVKNIAMFGIGLYIYSGEDLPEESIEIVKIELIDSEKGFELEELLKIALVDKNTFCKAYKIDSIIQLPLAKFQEAKTRLTNKAKEVEAEKDEVKDGNS
jgi:hypothetical protein